MEILLEILAFTIPALVVFLVSYFSIRSFLQHDQRNKLLEIKLKGQQSVTPIRLQAYERIVLLLERISPNNLVMRVAKGNMTASQFHTSLLQTIRNEYDHNLSQQVYITSKAWDYVKIARDETVKLVNSAAITMPKEATGQQLAAKVLENASASKDLPVDAAINFVKKEINQLF